MGDHDWIIKKTSKDEAEMDENVLVFIFPFSSSKGCNASGLNEKMLTLTVQVFANKKERNFTKQRCSPCRLNSQFQIVHNEL